MRIRRILWCAAFLICSWFTGVALCGAAGAAPPPATGGGAAEEQFRAEARTLFEAKCSQCHPLDKVVAAREGTEWWSRTVQRMSEKPGSGITRHDIAHIMYYVLQEMPPPGP